MDLQKAQTHKNKDTRSEDNSNKIVEAGEEMGWMVTDLEDSWESKPKPTVGKAEKWAIYVTESPKCQEMVTSGTSGRG